MVRTIAIVLGDNDFGNTFRPLLQTVHRAICYHSNSLTPEQLECIIRDGIEFHYKAFQVRHDMNDWASDYHHSDDTLDHLRSHTRILFDGDAEDDIELNDHDSGAWYLEQTTGRIFDY